MAQPIDSLEKGAFFVNVLPTGEGSDFTRQFTSQLLAEEYVAMVGDMPGYRVGETNFTPVFPREVIAAFRTKRDKIVLLAHQYEDAAKQRTKNNFRDPKAFPCEVCGKAHGNYECCERCNYNMHTCHFCGDDLGHSMVSVCYIVERYGL